MNMEMKQMSKTTHTFRTEKSKDTEIEIGDVESVDFKPHIKLKRWGNEVNFSVLFISDEIGTHTEVGDKIEWNDGKGTKARFYEKDSDEFEFEIELASKPVSNVIELSIKAKKLDFFYQPELTKEEIDAGCERPEHIVGSYAVYHSTKQGDHSQIGGNNYRAGKAFHIYRPKIIDSAGKEVWGTLDINVKNKLLTITIPQEFLDNAKYPLIVDPTFGYTTIGGSNATATSDNMLGSAFAGVRGLGVSITCYCATESTTQAAKGAIYKHSDSTKLTNAESGAVDVLSSWAWRTFVFGTPPILVAADYVLVLGFNAAASPGRFTIKYDTGVTEQGHHEAITYPTLPATASFSHNNFKYSIFCTYNLIIPIIMHHLRQQGIS
jgi:hypothetical protein